MALAYICILIVPIFVDFAYQTHTELYVIAWLTVGLLVMQIKAISYPKPAVDRIDVLGGLWWYGGRHSGRATCIMLNDKYTFRLRNRDYLSCLQRNDARLRRLTLIRNKFLEVRSILFNYYVLMSEHRKFV